MFTDSYARMIYGMGIFLAVSGTMFSIEGKILSGLIMSIIGGVGVGIGSCRKNRGGKL